MMDDANRADGQAANETTADIPQNRTLMLEQLTNEPAMRPVVVHGLETIRQVFDYYQPEVDIAFTNAEGVIKRETLTFRKIEDFGLRNIREQSIFLKNNEMRKEAYVRIITQLKTNKNLQAALANDGARKALLDAVNSMIAELKTNL